MIEARDSNPIAINHKPAKTNRKRRMEEGLFVEGIFAVCLEKATKKKPTAIILNGVRYILLLFALVYYQHKCTATV